MAAKKYDKPKELTFRYCAFCASLWLTVLVSLSATVACQAQSPTFIQFKKLTADGGQTYGYFGRSVSVNSDLVVVGASEQDTNRGAAYVIERNAGGSNDWGQVKKLTAADGETYDYFGGAVSVNGDLVVVGALGHDTNRGAAYVFERNTGGLNNWGQVKKLTADDGETYGLFGRSVSVNADLVVVGALGHDTNRGAAYVFERNAGGSNNWGQVKKLTADDRETHGHFGQSLSVNGDLVVVGAEAYGYTNAAGAAYLFERNAGGSNNWGQVKKLIAETDEAGTPFGASVATSGDVIVVSVWFFYGYGVDGTAYLFERNVGGDNNWGQVKELTAINSYNGVSFRWTETWLLWGTSRTSSG